MKKYKDFRKSGRFVLSTGDELHGELVLSGGATSLDLYSRELFSTQTSRDIFGTFHDLSKVSLLHCITTQGLGTGTRGDERYHFGSVFPHFVLFGDEHGYDFFWRLHVMDYRAGEDFNNPLLRAAAPLALAFALTGVGLLVPAWRRRWRSRRSLPR